MAQVLSSKACSIHSLLSPTVHRVSVPCVCVGNHARLSLHNYLFAPQGISRQLFQLLLLMVRWCVKAEPLFRPVWRGALCHTSRLMHAFVVCVSSYQHYVGTDRGLWRAPSVSPPEHAPMLQRTPPTPLLHGPNVMITKRIVGIGHTMGFHTTQHHHGHVGKQSVKYCRHRADYFQWYETNLFRGHTLVTIFLPFCSSAFLQFFTIACDHFLTIC